MSEFERFDEALERLLADESPRAEAEELSIEDQRMLQMAQLLRGSQGQEPEATFVADLHERLVARPRRISRRAAFLSGAGALAAGVLAGVGLDRNVGRSTNDESRQPLVGRNGRWMRVAQVAEVPDGTIHTFSAGAVNGFLMNRGGNFRAVSRVCTHMGCILNFSVVEQSFVCPCHGAEFDLTGHLQYGPGRERYGEALPPLPKLQVRVKGKHVEVWSV